VTDPGYLYDADDAYVPETDLATVHWVSLGYEEDCHCGATFHRDPGRPPAVEEHRPVTEHRYPAPVRSRPSSWDDPTSDPLADVQEFVRRAGPSWTIGEALRFLDPVPPRRTLSRWLKALEPDGSVPLPQGGPPAKTYPAAAIMERHARWVRRGSHLPI
jgi:hypothetical protein